VGLGVIAWQAELYQYWHQQSLWVPCSVDELIGLPLQKSDDGPGFLEPIACSESAATMVPHKICVVAQRSDLLTRLHGPPSGFLGAAIATYIKSWQFQTGPKKMNFQIATLARPSSRPPTYPNHRFFSRS